MAGREPRQERGVTRRLAIVEAAGRSFDAIGYHGAALAQIARDGGATLGGLAFYFPHKDDLARAVIDEQNARTFAALASGGPSPAAPVAGANEPATLEALIRGSHAIALLLLGDPVVRAGIRLSMELAELSEPTHAFYDEWTALIGEHARLASARGELRADLDPADVAVAAIGFFTGVHTVDAAMAGRTTLFHRLHVMWQVLLAAVADDAARPALLELARDVFGGEQPTPVPPGGHRAA